MNYRLIACDMDGTLLNSENKITTRTVEAIKAAKEKGVVFTLSTGRPVQGVGKYIDLLDLDCPVITYNGAVIVHSRSGEIIFSQNMDNDDARTVYNEAVKRDTMFLVWSIPGRTFFANSMFENMALYGIMTPFENPEVPDV